MNALELLRKELIGSFISRFSISDTWALYFGHYWLIAQDLISEDENLLNGWFQNNYPSFPSTVDKEYISKCAIVAAHMRKLVTGVQLDQSYNLTIDFEGDTSLIIPTSTPIVDWQWCLNTSGMDPYSDYIIACFWEGEIQINETQIKDL
ncbi:MAG: hypothetical protein NVV82_15860 [Sporocytophaga sp.]|nr:hypothetical protein [Sporocytophaga sp.]